MMPTIDAAFVEAHAEAIRAGSLRAGMLAWDRHSAAELKKLRERLDGLTGSGERFLLAVDHEGGPLFTQRSAGLTIFPGNMALGATGDPVLAYEAALAAGAELKALGIDMVFAPVVDVNSNPSNPIISIRSFGDEPDFVSRFSKEAIRGFLDAGIIPVLKHFPGHGDTDTDSHTGLPSMEKSEAAIRRVDLPPFLSGIKAGAPAIMTAHIRAPALGTGELPATLSAAVMTGLLRDEWGFEGVVVSDSLEMKGVLQGRSITEAAAAAVLAGCDLLLTGRAELAPLRQAIADAVPESRLDLSVVRLRALVVPKVKTVAAKPKIAAAAAEASVTLLRDLGAMLPIASGTPALFVVFRSQGFAAEARGFQREVLARFPRAEFLFLDPNPGKDEADAALERARSAGTIVVSTYHWGKAPIASQKRLVGRLLRLGKPAVLLSAMSPYDIPHYPDAKTVLLTYGFTEVSLTAAARVLSGEIAPRGRLPVSLSESLPRGSGLDAFLR